MDSHIQGRIAETNQVGAIPCLRGFEFDYTETNLQPFCTILASTTDPVLLEAFPTILTAFNAGTTNVVQVFDQFGNLLITYPDPTTIGIQSYRTILITQKTQLNLIFSYTGTPPTTGNGILMVRVSGLGRGLGLV